MCTHHSNNIKFKIKNHLIESDFFFLKCSLIAADDVVPYRFGEKSAHSLAMSGFIQVVFKPYEGYML